MQSFTCEYIINLIKNEEWDELRKLPYKIASPYLFNKNVALSVYFYLDMEYYPDDSEFLANAINNDDKALFDFILSQDPKFSIPKLDLRIDNKRHARHFAQALNISLSLTSGELISVLRKRGEYNTLTSALSHVSTPYESNITPTSDEIAERVLEDYASIVPFDTFIILIKSGEFQAYKVIEALLNCERINDAYEIAFIFIRKRIRKWRSGNYPFEEVYLSIEDLSKIRAKGDTALRSVADLIKDCMPEPTCTSNVIEYGRNILDYKEDLGINSLNNPYVIRMIIEEQESEKDIIRNEIRIDDYPRRIIEQSLKCDPYLCYFDLNDFFLLEDLDSILLMMNNTNASKDEILEEVSLTPTNWLPLIMS